jgi:hypothetical protein
LLDAIKSRSEIGVFPNSEFEVGRGLTEPPRVIQIVDPRRSVI